MKNRDLVWDALKGVAIILMVIGHSGCPAYLRRFIYLFHMGVFFYVSGRYLNIKGIDVVHFLKKKGYGLYVPFVKWGGIFVLLHNVFYLLGWYELSYSQTETIKHLLGTLMFKDTEGLLGASWFLQSLFKALLLTYIICLIPIKKIQPIVVLCIYTIGWLLCAKHIHLFYSLNREMVVTACVWLGYMTKKVKHIESWRYYALSIVILLGGIWSYPIDLVGDEVGFYGALPLFTIAGVVLLLGIVRLLKKYANRLFVYLALIGQNTIPVFMLHFVGFHILSTFLVKLGIGHAQSLSSPTVLEGLNHNLWFVLYTLVGILIPLAYVKVKAIVLSRKK